MVAAHASMYGHKSETNRPKTITLNICKSIVISNYLKIHVIHVHTYVRHISDIHNGINYISNGNFSHTHFDCKWGLSRSAADAAVVAGAVAAGAAVSAVVVAVADAGGGGVVHRCSIPEAE